MTPEQAKRALLKHAGISKDFDDGLLAWLRPFRAVRDDHLLEIFEAIYVLAAQPTAKQPFDNEVILATWTICSFARGGTENRASSAINDVVARRQPFILKEDKERLDAWIGAIETYTQRQLAGRPGHRHCFDCPMFLRYGLAPRATFAVPSIIETLARHCVDEPTWTEGDEVDLCVMLAAMGKAATAASDVLQQLASITRYTTVRSAALAAQQVVAPNQDGSI